MDGGGILDVGPQILYAFYRTKSGMANAHATITSSGKAANGRHV